MAGSGAKLKKELKLLDIFAIATGSTLSGGLFLLPGIAAEQVGASIILAYLLAVVPLIPAMISKVELSTGLPKSGGFYYFLDRTMGPLIGTIGGLGTWLVYILKVAFALIGMSAYIRLFVPDINITLVAVAFAAALGVLNIVGAKKSGQFQIILAILLLIILTAFIGAGFFSVNIAFIEPAFDVSSSDLLASAGLVFVSYVGISKVASVAEEIDKPEKNLPRGVFLSIFISVLVYFLGMTVLVGVVPMEELRGNLTPIATAAEKMIGFYGVVIVSFGALLAFLSVANAGTLSASRYPLAMSRDHVFPASFRALNKDNTPVMSIVVTVAVIILCIVFLDPLKIAKLASAFLLVLFALICLAVIIIRESKIESYDPGYKSPLYPYMQISGIVMCLGLITQMGALPIIFSASLILACVLWYWYYAKDRVVRNGAIYHIFERLGKQRYEGLDREFRGILKEKGLREEDPFAKIVMRGYAFSAEEGDTFEKTIYRASNWFSHLCDSTPEYISRQFLEGTLIGATPVSKGVALPHFRVKGINRSEIVMVRAEKGVEITVKSALTDYKEETQTVNAIFFLMSPEHEPGLHLRMLAQIAGRVEQADFKEAWLSSETHQELKEAVLQANQFLAAETKETSPWVNTLVMDCGLPSSCSISMINRDGHIFVPNERTPLEVGDRLTIIGPEQFLKEINN